MKKTFFMCLLLIAAAQFTKAQITNATGSVKDDKGSPLHFVFISDDQYKNAAFTDSLGNFTITVQPDSKLKFDLPGYESTTIAVDKNNAALQVVLKSSGSTASQASITAKVTAQSSGNEAATTYGSGGVIAPGHQKGNTHGNMYLFDTFEHGFLITASGQLVHDPNDRYDYDKMGGALLFSNDNKTISQISWDQTKSFMLVSNTDQPFVFEKAPAIDQSHYVQVLASGKKYKIYKLIKTKFVKSDYVNTGVASRGNDYDEYVDDADYYVIDMQGGQPQKLSLKKKSIKEDFAKDADKVNKYLSDNSGSIDDAYLSKLGAYMNQ
jgi:hypothetical protein